MDKQIHKDHLVFSLSCKNFLEIFKITLACLLLALLPGCGALIDWSKDAINQGDGKKVVVQKAREAIRSVTVYDQFSLLGKFDALFLSDYVRDTFVAMYILKWGKSDKQWAEFSARQKEENKQYIMFYVLYPYDQTPLGMIDSIWSLFLRIEDGAEHDDNHAQDAGTGVSVEHKKNHAKTYAPLEIRTVELSPEYQQIFGPLYTRFKQAYQIKFDARDDDDRPLITSHTQRISLCFRSVAKEVALTWRLREDAAVSHDRARRTVRDMFDTHAAHKKLLEKKDTRLARLSKNKQEWRKNKKESDIEELV
jgi:hypothetical protein